MNNKLTDERVLQRLSQFEGAYKEACALQDDDFASECADIVRVLREVLERRKADSAEPIYQNYPDDGWSDCSKEIYENLTELGCRTRIVYAAPQPAPQPSVGFVDATGTDCECVCPVCKHEFSIQFEY
ncbi:hypothetical protein G3D33_001406 [Salmonella enterica subsp. salamae]|nr:hypothetical protein [Salmonella enterica subsp. salamae]